MIVAAHAPEFADNPAFQLKLALNALAGATKHVEAAPASIEQGGGSRVGSESRR